MAKKLKTITKTQVLKALTVEPLQAGSWVSAFVDRIFPKKVDPNCNVCAVGAVMKRAMNKPMKPGQLQRLCNRVTKNYINRYDAEYNVVSTKTLLSEKNYLGALSSYFEQQGESIGSDNTTVLRRKAKAFVRKHFPSRIRVAV